MRLNAILETVALSLAAVSTPDGAGTRWLLVTL
jgi:hypothetical protein